MNFGYQIPEYKKYNNAKQRLSFQSTQQLCEPKIFSPKHVSKKSTIQSSIIGNNMTFPSEDNQISLNQKIISILRCANFNNNDLVLMVLKNEKKIQKYKARISSYEEKINQLTDLAFKFELHNKQIKQESQSNTGKLQNIIQKLITQSNAKEQILQNQLNTLNKQIQTITYQKQIVSKYLKEIVQDKLKVEQRLEETIFRQKMISLKLSEYCVTQKIQNLPRLYAESIKQKDSLSLELKNMKFMYSNLLEECQIRIVQKQQIIKKMSAFNVEICQLMLKQRSKFMSQNICIEQLKLILKNKNQSINRVSSQRQITLDSNEEQIVQQNFLLEQELVVIKNDLKNLQKQNRKLLQTNKDFSAKITHLNKQLSQKDKIIQEKSQIKQSATTKKTQKLFFDKYTPKIQRKSSEVMLRNFKKTKSSQKIFFGDQLKNVTNLGQNIKLLLENFKYISILKKQLEHTYNNRSMPYIKLCMEFIKSCESMLQQQQHLKNIYEKIKEIQIKQICKSQQLETYEEQEQCNDKSIYHEINNLKKYIDINHLNQTNRKFEQ